MWCCPRTEFSRGYDSDRQDRTGRLGLGRTCTWARNVATHSLWNGGSRNRGYYNLSRVTRMSRRTCIRLRRVASGRLFGHIAHSTWHADSKGSHRLRKLMTNLGRPRGFRIAVTRARCAPWQVRSQFQLVVLISIIIPSAPSPSPSHCTSFRSCCRELPSADGRT